MPRFGGAFLCPVVWLCESIRQGARAIHPKAADLIRGRIRCRLGQRSIEPCNCLENTVWLFHRYLWVLASAVGEVPTGRQFPHVGAGLPAIDARFGAEAPCMFEAAGSWEGRLR
jgi:hypothetical protein